MSALSMTMSVLYNASLSGLVKFSIGLIGIIFPIDVLTLYRYCSRFFVFEVLGSQFDFKDTSDCMGFSLSDHDGDIGWLHGRCGIQSFNSTRHT